MTKWKQRIIDCSLLFILIVSFIISSLQSFSELRKIADELPKMSGGVDIAGAKIGMVLIVLRVMVILFTETNIYLCCQYFIKQEKCPSLTMINISMFVLSFCLIGLLFFISYQMIGLKLWEILFSILLIALFVTRSLFIFLRITHRAKRGER